MIELEQAYESLAAWCRARGWAGHDPFDGLNSRLFQSTPLKRSRVARLAWTQAFKRAPVNLRAPALVPAGRNAKGTALFALAALSRFRATGAGESEARELLDALLAARLEGGSGASAWGYNFDWQGRAFFAPRGTPTVVPTAFAARALVEAARAFNDEKYLRAARGACEFILGDLKRSAEAADEICFSYTPLDETRVFNASLLAGEALASVGALTGEGELLTTAARAARYVVRRQRADGSWAYGAAGFQGWADNFHTAFVLTSLARIMHAGGEDMRAEFAESLRRGYEFWRENFFLADGWPKYYHDNPYPADAHSTGAAVVALVELKETMPDALTQADRVLRWTLAHLRDPRRGFFYYQRRRFYTIRTPYMRWTQAWMMYALARRLEIAECGMRSAD
ncbi:MAG: hypothetical protein QOD32_3624 [Pyrinomonadaceae bacterium]|jgi:uncharacterized protein YyaL (SSP411 family)|nr:hypothetical protein [Pyrinomonadaceae bacterium]